MIGLIRRRVRTLPPGGHHGFFKTLPRELRDKIYDRSYKKFFRQLSSAGSPMLNVTIPYVALRLVNRQAKIEYDERVAKREQLTALDTSVQYLFPSTFLKDCALFSHTTNLTIEFWSCRIMLHTTGPCDSLERLQKRERWLDELASQLPCLCRIRVSLLITHEQCLDATIESLDSMTERPKVVEVKVKHTGFRVGVRCYLSRSKVPTFATWTKQHGLVRDSGAVESARESGLLQPSGSL